MQIVQIYFQDINFFLQLIKIPLNEVTYQGASVTFAPHWKCLVDTPLSWKEGVSWRMSQLFGGKIELRVAILLLVLFLVLFLYYIFSTIFIVCIAIIFCVFLYKILNFCN